MRGSDAYDGVGCNEYTGCILICGYFRSSLYAELLPLSKECQDNRQLLAKSSLANQDTNP